jgi:hypothetical protein
MRTNHNVPQSDRRVSFHPSPTIIAQSTVSTPTPNPRQAMATPTLKIKIYRNERLGFELKHLELYKVMEETASGVSFGFGRSPYLTISLNPITDYKAYKPCKYGDEAYRQTFPCLESGNDGGKKEILLKQIRTSRRKKLLYR